MGPTHLDSRFARPGTELTRGNASLDALLIFGCFVTAKTQRAPRSSLRNTEKSFAWALRSLRLCGFNDVAASDFKKETTERLNYSDTRSPGPLISAQ